MAVLEKVLSPAQDDMRGKQHVEFVALPYERKGEGKNAKLFPLKNADKETVEVVCFRAYAAEHDLGGNLSALHEDLRRAAEGNIIELPDDEATAALGSEVTRFVAVREREDFIDFAKTKRGKTLIDVNEKHLRVKDTEREFWFNVDAKGVVQPFSQGNFEYLEFAIKNQVGNKDTERNSRPKNGGWLDLTAYTKGKCMEALRPFIGKALIKGEWRPATTA